MADFILRLHEGFLRLDPRIWIFGFFAAIAYIVYMFIATNTISFTKSFREKSTAEKIIFVPAVFFLIYLFIFEFFLLKDVPRNLSPEITARTFAANLFRSRRSIDEMIKKRSAKIFTPNYLSKFIENKDSISKDFKGIQEMNEGGEGQYDYWGEDFSILESQCKFPHNELQSPTKPIDLSKPGHCRVVLSTDYISEIKKRAQARNKDVFSNIIQQRIDLYIDLIQVTVPSRFFGNNVRWRISGLSYAKSKPFTFKEQIESWKGLKRD